MLQQLRIMWLPAVVLAMCGGCSGADSEDRPDTYPVRGQVLQSNGAPLPGGVIEFHAKDFPGNDAMGLIQKDGTFAVGTFAKADGAVPGRYVVTVDPKVPGITKTGGPVPKKFSSDDTSPIKVEVQAQENVLQAFRLN
jgi:hypothetical protein